MTTGYLSNISSTESSCKLIGFNLSSLTSQNKVGEIYIMKYCDHSRFIFEIVLVTVLSAVLWKNILKRSGRSFSCLFIVVIVQYVGARRQLINDF